MVDGDVFLMSEAADIAELLAAGFARASRSTKVGLQKELAKSAATLTLPSKMLPMLFLRITKKDAVFANRKGY